MAKMITGENFEEVVLNSERPVLVDFWAPWCGPCQQLGPVIEELSESVRDRALVGKINVADQPELARKFRVMSIPTVMVFQGGKPVKSSVGLHSREELEELIG